MRTELLKHGARFSVVKNTLTKRAAEEAGVSDLVEFLDGPTAIAFVGDGDMVAVAKALSDSAKQTKILALKGGILEGKPMSAEEIQRLAALPSPEVLRGQVLGAIVGPLNAIAGLVNAPLQNLHGLLDARIEQLREQGDASDAGGGSSRGAARRGGRGARARGGGEPGRGRARGARRDRSRRGTRDRRRGGRDTRRDQRRD